MGFHTIALYVEPSPLLFLCSNIISAPYMGIHSIALYVDRSTLHFVRSTITSALYMGIDTIALHMELSPLISYVVLSSVPFTWASTRLSFVWNRQLYMSYVVPSSVFFIWASTPLAPYMESSTSHFSIVSAIYTGIHKFAICVEQSPLHFLCSTVISALYMDIHMIALYVIPSPILFYVVTSLALFTWASTTLPFMWNWHRCILYVVPSSVALYGHPHHSPLCGRVTFAFFT